MEIYHPITVKNRLIRLSSAALAVGVMTFSADQGRSVYATDNTPTQIVTPTRTSTPDVLATQIAEARKNLAELQAQKRKEQELEGIRKQIEALQNPPTETPKPQPTATPGPRINEVVVAIETVVAGRMNEKATATARAETKLTPTPRPIPVPRGNGERREEGGFPLVPVAVAALLAGGSIAYWRSKRIRQRVNYAASWAAVGAIYYGTVAMNFIRTRLGGGAGPGGGAPAGGP